MALTRETVKDALTADNVSPWVVRTASLAVIGLSGYGAPTVSLPEPVPAAALNSEAVFRLVFGAAIFVLGMVAVTIAEKKVVPGLPFERVTYGKGGLEWAKKQEQNDTEQSAWIHGLAGEVEKTADHVKLLSQVVNSLDNETGDLARRIHDLESKDF